jgi:hypothetical protein
VSRSTRLRIEAAESWASTRSAAAGDDVGQRLGARRSGELGDLAGDDLTGAPVDEGGERPAGGIVVAGERDPPEVEIDLLDDVARVTTQAAGQVLGDDGADQAFVDGERCGWVDDGTGGRHTLDVIPALPRTRRRKSGGAGGWLRCQRALLLSSRLHGSNERCYGELT